MALEQAYLIKRMTEQLSLLAKSCLEYDVESPKYAIEIAHRLRVILHQTGSSHSVLHQLNMQNIDFVSTANNTQITTYQNGAAITPVFSLLKTIWHYKKLLFALFPKLDDSQTRANSSFNHWWNSEVVASYAGCANSPGVSNVSGEPDPTFLENGYSFTRKELTLKYANKLGGSHLDPNIDPLLRYIDDNKKVDGWNHTIVNKKTGEVEIISSEESPFTSTVRQIAHELFISLNNQFISSITNIQSMYFDKISEYTLIGHNKDMWDAGARADQALEDIGNAFTTIVVRNDKSAALGVCFTEPDSDSDYTRYDFCILAKSDGNFCAMERGRIVSEFYPYSELDTFGFVTAEIDSLPKIKYIHNGYTFCTSRQRAFLPLTFHIAAKHVGAGFKDSKWHSVIELNP